MDPIERFKDELRGIADTIREKTGTTEPIPFFELKEKLEDLRPEGETVAPNTIFLEDETGYEVAATLLAEEVELTATTNDIREGTSAVLEEGYVVGEKFIPPHFTSSGAKLVLPNREYELPLPLRDAYDYEHIMCIICPLEGSIDTSIIAERTVINNKVYPARSNIALSTLTKDHDTKTIKFNLINDSNKPHLIRYISYKEEL
jgi:hypothetical protein